MSILYLKSSLARTAVLLSGRSANGLSSSVRTFYAPKVNGVTLNFFTLIRPQMWDYR